MAFEQYLSAGMHIGMKQQTKGMKRFVYKIRDDGLAVLDLQTIAKRIELAGKFLSKFEKIMVVARKPIAQKAALKFAEAVGAKAIIGRFLPGIITNPSFREYYEPDVLFVADPSSDSQAMDEAVKMRIPIVALADTFNETNLIDLIIPVNNKGRKSIATIYWLLAGEILKNKGEEMKIKPEEFESREERTERRKDDRNDLRRRR